MSFKVIGRYIDFGNKMINIDFITDISFSQCIKLYSPRKYGDWSVYKESHKNGCTSYDIVLSDEEFERFETYIRNTLPLQQRRSSFEF